MPAPTTFLLDKGIVRRVFEATVRVAADRPPTETQLQAVSVYQPLMTIGAKVCVTPDPKTRRNAVTRVLRVLFSTRWWFFSQAATYDAGPDAYDNTALRARMPSLLPTPRSVLIRLPVNWAQKCALPSIRD